MVSGVDTSLVGLGNFESTGTINIRENDALVTLNGLNSISTIHSLYIEDNLILDNISALENVFYESGNKIITGNPQLAICSYLNLCTNYLEEPWDFVIQNNAIGCNSIAEFKTGCHPYCPTELTFYAQTSIDSLVSVFPNCFELESLNLLGNSITNVAGLNQLTKVDTLNINQTQLANFNGLINLQNSSSLTIANNSNLTSLLGFQNLNSITSGIGILITNNPQLQNLNPLSSVTSFSGGIQIDNNDALTTLNGLQNLPGLTSILRVENNLGLSDISDLGNIILNINELVIKNNPNLSVCNYNNICSYVMSGGFSEIDNNAPGCATLLEVQNACNIVGITDSNFLNALLNHNPPVDLNNDGNIQYSEAELFSGFLNVSNQSIQDMTGIEAFININGLDCSINDLTSINLSNNTNLELLRIFQNNISVIDISNNTLLKEVEVNFNPITSLDTSNNTLLEIILASFCTDLINVNVTNNQNLEILELNNTSVSSINLSQNPLLNKLAIENAYLTSIDVSLNPNLTRLKVRDNQISNLDISLNSFLEYLYVTGNSLSTIDFSNNPEIFAFRAGSPELDFINAKNGNNTNIVNFEVVNSPNLEFICVDDIIYAEQNFTVPQGVIFVENCELSNLEFNLDHSILFYPNPFKDIITFSSQNNVEIKNLILFSIKGEVLLETSSITMDLNNLSSGIYFVKIITNQGNISKKLIKK